MASIYSTLKKSGGSSGSSGSYSSKSSGTPEESVGVKVLRKVTDTPAASGSSGITSSFGASSGGSSYSSGSVNRDYHQEARDAAARGDWSAVSRALAARQDKINAQGGNDRGTSNAQILQSLQSQYGSSYSALSPTMQNTLSAAASGQASGRGWEDGVDYLAQAQAYARAGDMEAAQDALRRRGFKMADTGSTGGGTSQDQAYALIQNLYDHSAGAASSYQSQLAENARRLQEHPTQFGTGSNPALADKHFLSQDGQYIIYYDSKGTPFRAEPNNGQYGSTKYTPEYKSLMERYYSGEGDAADLRRQLHNLDVASSGSGRLIDQDWNWASGEAQPLRDAYQYWTDQDKQTPVSRLYTQSYDDLTSGTSGRSTQYAGRPSGGGSSGSGLVSSSGYGDLTQYIRDMYQQSLAAQLASLQSGYEQNLADINAQDSLISQAYQAQRNQAAGQSDLQRMYMAELGNYQGLNTGATGQLALAQSMALQNNLASLGASESQDLSANGLARNQLGSAYRGSVDAAIAQNGAQMSEALYNELARQIQAEQTQTNWEAQFNYQREQDALSRQYQQKQAAAEYQAQLAQAQAAAKKQSVSNAWDYAQLLLKNGVMPDETTLLTAGIDPGSAQSLADSYKWQLGQKYATKSSGGSSGGDTSLKAGMGGGNYDALFSAALASGRPDSFIPNNYKAYGFSSSSNLLDDYYNWDGTVRGGNASFDYSPSEGFFTWNGSRYSSPGSFIQAIEAAGLNSAEKKALSQKMKMYGIDVEF